MPLCLKTHEQEGWSERGLGDTVEPAYNQLERKFVFLFIVHYIRCSLYPGTSVNTDLGVVYL